ncbi:MAG: tyrosine-type recombinase/integrase [Chloroflexota bacterium]
MTTSLVTIDHIQPIINMVTNAVSSDHTRRAYSRALTDFLTWYRESEQTQLNKAAVNAHVTWLRATGVSASSINQRLSAIRKLALEAADNGLIEESTGQAIRRVEGVRQEGKKLGNWLNQEHAQALLNAPELYDELGQPNLKGLRDRALLTTLIGCGLRRTEATNLTMEHIQQREGRWVIVDLSGKRNRIRSVPMPSWTKLAIDVWTVAAAIESGPIFLAMRKGGRILDHVMSDQGVWDVVKFYADQVQVNVGPHDLRRTFAKLARKGKAELDQIQLSLGHASVETTQKYVGEEQDLHSAPCDVLGLRL